MVLYRPNIGYYSIQLFPNQYNPQSVLYRSEFVTSKPKIKSTNTRTFKTSNNLDITAQPNTSYLPPDTTPYPTTITSYPRINSSSHCKNGGSGPFCCLNGANNIDCCTNNGRGRFCCKNGSNNRDCCINEGSGPNCCEYIDPRPICKR